MITQEHLLHWLSEMQWQLNGILKEIGKDKLKDKTGIKLAVSPNPEEDVFVSFEYLQEKATTLNRLLGSIKHDMVVDSMKKAVDVTTEGWKDEDKLKLKTAIHQQNMTLMAKVKMPDGKTKYMYGRNKEDLEMYAKKINATILETSEIES